MALCDNCLRIPFDNLPEFPKIRSKARIADRTNLPRFFEKRQDHDRGGPLGFSWQESLDALANSARLGCPICALLQNGVQIWLDTYQNAVMTDAFFVEYGQETEPIPHGQVLWISKRFGGNDGFSVLARTPNSYQSFVMLTGISFSVIADHPLAHRFPLRPVQRNSGLLQTLDVAAAWVDGCANDHENCPGSDALFPSRVLDVGSDGDIIKLVEPEAGSKGKYASLSHCWGSSIPLTTTLQSREARMSGIPISELPRTFHDAVVIARHLRIRFLWIDSLCIYQDDRADWARESSNMTAVYSNAYVVIAASHAADSNVGCFHARPHRPSSVVSIPNIGEICAQLVYNENESPWLSDFEGEPLSERGWALQETILATRALYFTKTQIYFECNAGRVSEDGFSSSPGFGRRTIRLRQNPERSISEDRDLWNKLLWDYGVRKLTHATDKLPAMSGLAKLFAQRFRASYVAGLWSDALVQGLTWQCIGTRAPMSTTEYVGPSWSWASYAGIAAISWDDERWEKLARVKGRHLELQDEENPYGAVKSAWIQLHAPMAQLIPGESSNVSDEEENRRIRAGLPPRTLVRLARSESQKEIFSLSLDHEDAKLSGNWRKWKLYILILAGIRDSGNMDSDDESKSEETPDRSEADGAVDFYYGLAVIPASENSVSEWKRVGWLFCEGKEADEMIKNISAWETVTLV